MTGRRPFSIQLMPAAGVFAVVVRGEIDIATAADFQDDLRNALREHVGSPLLVDLEAVTFIDSKGVSALVRVLGPLRGSGASVAVVAERPIRMMLEIAGLDRVLGVWESRADALAALAGGEPS
jgi:anti-anti-sigma factor